MLPQPVREDALVECCRRCWIEGKKIERRGGRMDGSIE